MSYKGEVDRGTTILDRVVPAWRTQIDSSNLDMSSLKNCVLSQLFGGYMKGLEALGVPFQTADDVDCGFDLGKDDLGKMGEENYKKLTDEWKLRLIGVTL